jgi:hypothetical protein
MIMVTIVDISDGDIRGDASLPHLYAAYDGRELTTVEQFETRLVNEEQIYWIDAGRDISALPTPDALHQGAAGWLYSTLIHACIDPTTINADDKHWCYRKEDDHGYATD